MGARVLYLSDPVRGAVWANIFAREAPDLHFQMGRADQPCEDARYLVCWQLRPQLLAQLPSLQVVFSVGAGVDQLGFEMLAPQVQVVRMIEPGIAAGVVEYVSMSVLALHRKLFDYQRQQASRIWQEVPALPASRLRIGVMGMGVLGRAVLANLVSLGYHCAGWSRTPQELHGVRSYAGGEQLQSFLAGCDILICQLPLTDATRGILNRQAFGALPKGASIINVGRGAHLVGQDLLDALASGQLSRAILDVTDPEPLPENHAFWHHPSIMITPHIATVTRPESAARAVIANIRLHQRGATMAGAIDRTRGY